MKSINKRKIISLIIISFLYFSTFLSMTYDNYNNNVINSNEFTDNDEIKSIKSSTNGLTDRQGKEFSYISRSNLNCYINNEQPSLNVQPSIYIPNHYLSHAGMTFENITAHNYTRFIETEPSEFYFSSIRGPVYVYQKFAVEIDMYVNNVSILIQDISNPFNDSPDRFWEVAIVNCSNDLYGTPNPNKTLGELKKPPPINFAAHWELFDFKNEGDGPIFLNTSLTNSTMENGIEKFWFALKIKIPPNDFASEENPKFLYFSQDSEDPSDIGEGETFAESPEFSFANETTNYVVENKTVIGDWIRGNLKSFEKFNDSDRYFSNDYSHYLNITTKFELNNLIYSPFNYTELMWLLTFSRDFQNLWWGEHYKYIYNIDINIATNISKNDLMNATLFAWSHGYFQWTETGYFWGWEPTWINMSQFFDINFDLNQTSESLITYKLDNPFQKLIFLTLLNGKGNLFNNPTNSILFQFFYAGPNNYHFNVSIDQFTIDIGELSPLDEIQKHDPRIQRLYYIDNSTIINNTNFYGPQSIDALRTIDEKYFKAQAETNNLSIEFNAKIIPELNNSLWEGVDIYDWISTFPNPIIPQVDIRVTSNVSIVDKHSLNYSVLEVYKGDKEIDIFPKELNVLDWIPISGDRDFAVKTETTITIPIDAGWTWLMLQFMNKSDNNIRLRLRYVGNFSFENFNVSINEFRLVFYIQNAINSDIASKLGLGLYTPTLKPEDIEMKNFGTLLSNLDNQTGLWDSYIQNGIPELGIFEFNVTSLWHAISFDVLGTYEIYKFIVDMEFEDDFEAYYRVGTNYFSVEVSDGTGDPIEDLEVTFELVDNNDKVVDDDTAVTNEDGIAKGALKFKEVGDGYKIKVSYDKEGIYASEDIDSDEFRIVDDLTLFMDIFLAWLPYILIGLAAIITFATVRHHKLNKLRKFWAREALILDDLLKISYILIIHKDAGVTIYNKQISMELDSDLIGGFLTAISQFRSELKKDEIPKSADTGIEMDYYDFKIVITDGTYVRVALILDATPSENLKENQWEFTRRFEMKYGDTLSKFEGDIRPFRETDDLVDRLFDIKLMYPLQLAKHWEFTKLSKLEKALVEVGLEMQKERKFIFASSLLSYGLAGRKESRDQIISTILDLKRRGLLIPIEIE